jgi:integrase
MDWSEIDKRWWTIPGERAKNKKPHRIFLTDFAFELLPPRKKSGPCFPSPDGQGPMGANVLARAMNRWRHDDDWPATIGAFSPHDLRRSAASGMTSMGISRLVVSKILNHAEPGVTAIYDRSSYDREKEKALTAWSRHLVALRDGKADTVNVVNLPQR